MAKVKIIDRLSPRCGQLAELLPDADGKPTHQRGARHWARVRYDTDGFTEFVDPDAVQPVDTADPPHPHS